MISSTGDVAHCLNAGGMGRQDYETETMVAKPNCSRAADLDTYVAHTLKAEGFDASENETGRGTPKPGDPCHPLAAGAHPPAVAFDMRGREGGAMPEGPHDTANIRAASGGSSRSYVATSWAVRRLMPVECERLQGFPDGFTDVPWRGKSHSPDGRRYKALGNSMAVNVMRWLGDRIELVDEIPANQTPAK